MSYEYKYLKYKRKIEKLQRGGDLSKRQSIAAERLLDSKLDKVFDYFMKHKISFKKIKRWTIDILRKHKNKKLVKKDGGGGVLHSMEDISSVAKTMWGNTLSYMLGSTKNPDTVIETIDNKLFDMCESKGVCENISSKKLFTGDLTHMFFQYFYFTQKYKNVCEMDMSDYEIFNNLYALYSSRIAIPAKGYKGFVYQNMNINDFYKQYGNKHIFMQYLTYNESKENLANVISNTINNCKDYSKKTLADVISNTDNNYNDSSKKNKVIIPISIMLVNIYKEQITESIIKPVVPLYAGVKTVFNHANILIYDLNNETLERFEPYGGQDTIYNHKELDDMIINLMKEKNIPISKYYSPLDYCPYKIFQSKAYSDDFYCAMWSMWYADIRLKNPGLFRNKTVKIAISKIKDNPYSYDKFIKNYHDMMNKTMKELSTLCKLGDMFGPMDKEQIPSNMDPNAVLVKMHTDSGHIDKKQIESFMKCAREHVSDLVKQHE